MIQKTINQIVIATAATAFIVFIGGCEKKADAPVKAAPAAAEPAKAEPAKAKVPPAAAAAATGTPAEQGKAIYAKVCVACHSVDGSKLVGPTMKGMYGRKVKGTKGEEYVLDDAGITASIKDPSKNIAEGYPPAMVLPAPLSDADITNVIAYLKTIK